MMRQYRIYITEQAEGQLSSIKNYYIEQLNSPKMAINTLSLLRSGIKKLEFMPYRIKIIDEMPWRELGYRKLKINNYYIYYWINDKKSEVYVIAVIYTKMDQKGQLSKL